MRDYIVMDAVFQAPHIRTVELSVVNTESVEQEGAERSPGTCQFAVISTVTYDDDDRGSRCHLNLTRREPLPSRPDRKDQLHLLADIFLPFAGGVESRPDPIEPAGECQRREWLEALFNEEGDAKKFYLWVVKELAEIENEKRAWYRAVTDPERNKSKEDEPWVRSGDYGWAPAEDDTVG